MAHLIMSLRAVNHRLTSLPVQQLPAIAASLAASISECRELLSAPQSQRTGRTDSDHAVQVHKLVTRLSSLLQDRTFEGRWTAVVLIKALVEAGQWEILRGSEPFVRGLMGILNKPDPTSTKTMAVITLTRIFHLTYQYPTLVREITTPSLPGFVTSTLNLVSVKPPSEPTRRLKPNSPFLEVVLCAYSELIARHPTIFRPFTAQIHSVLQALVGSKSASHSQSVVDISEQLFIALHHCAPKNTGGEEWKNACRMTITSIHATANHVLRAVVEQWESVDPSLRQQLGHSIDYSSEVGSPSADALGLTGWRGLDSGIDRLLMLLRMLSTFLKTATATTVSIPVGSILDLTARLMSVTVPSDAGGVQANPSISRTEREHLLTELPRIHAACMRLLRTLVNTLETAVLPIAQTILEQTLWVFGAEKFNKKIRASVYNLIHVLISRIGPSMTKKNVSSLNDIVRTSCTDILPQDAETSTKDSTSDAKGKSKTNVNAINADSFLNPNLKQGRQLINPSSSSKFPRLARAAATLLPAILTNLRTEYLAPALRAEIDRTIIMTSSKDAMFASVLNPFPAARGRGANISIVPFLARSYASGMDVEALIRPRMPVLTNTNAIGQYVAPEDDEEEEEEIIDPASSSETLPESTGLLQQSTTPNLQALVDSKLSAITTTTSSLSKRTYTEDPATQTQQPLISSNTSTNPGGVQIKKARVESTVSTSPLGQSEPVSSKTTIQSSSFKEDTSMLDVDVDAVASSSSGPVTAGQSSVSQVQTATQPLVMDEDSDDEMPTLNVEPDTDEEEEE
ncbi:rRNA processing/ribosome biogenesis-domain-containing protein [Aspergillus pseudodeflectus]|uniref:Pre-rRNA-processing protein RIX1 n=1 Tax=Aspergillus pseudodeflectus TaxID=176178 RepID=A0ABR4KRL4_9EURO